jgi:hypothetical protein
LCISWRWNLWLWTAVSGYTGLILAWFVGDCSRGSLAALWEKVPQEKVPQEKVPQEKVPQEKVPQEKVPHRWQRRRVYTDGYAVYACFFSAGFPPGNMSSAKRSMAGRVQRKVSTNRCGIGVRLWYVVPAPNVAPWLGWSGALPWSCRRIIAPDKDDLADATHPCNGNDSPSRGLG